MRVGIKQGGDNVLKWAAKNLSSEDFSGPEDFGESVAFGIVMDGRPIGAAVFSEYRGMRFGADMRCALAATDPRWCQRHVLRTLFEYVFIDAKCARLTSIVREGNTKALELNLRLGFRKEGTIRRGFNGKTNAIVFGMLKHECKWISHGKREVSAAA